MTAVTHAMTRAGRDLWRAEAVCRAPGVPAHRMVVPNTSSLLTAISCCRCRQALGWPKTMNPWGKLNAFADD